MLRLSGRVQYYSWGSTSAIPELLGFSPDGRAYAEVWFGAHPSAPSLAMPTTSLVPPTGYDRWATKQPLNQTISLAPQGWLGDEIAAQYDGQLPYLVKLLAAAKPLSLQAHPTVEQAREAFDREHAEGTPVQDRNYQDRNHKPEALIALTPTLAYAGFRRPEEIAADLLVLAEKLEFSGDSQDSVREQAAQALRAVVGLLTKNGESNAQRIEAGFVAALDFSPELLAAALSVLFQYDAADPARGCATFSSFEVARYVLDFFPRDNGVLAALFLNHVSLAPGEALSVGAGVIHCYIHGFGIEVMANSDNVLRAGLTPKRVDVPELVRVVNFEPEVVPIIHGKPSETSKGCATVHAVDYVFPFDEFEVTVLETTGEQPAFEIESNGPRVVLGIEGVVIIDNNEGHCAIAAGEAVFAGDSEVIAISGQGKAIVVSVPTRV